MSNFGNMLKGGWHPKDEKKTSLRGDFKGVNQLAGWVGKGKTADESKDPKNHSSRPMNTLVDPASFGPPPKHVAYHGPQAAAESSASAPAPAKPTSAYQTGGLGAAVHPVHPPTQQVEEEEEEPAQPAPPPVPYRANTTGLRTDNLPPQPVKRVDDEMQSPSSATTQARPQPPPRLPARQNSYPDAHAPEPPPSYPSAMQKSSQVQPLAAASSSQMSELQARFARMPKASSGTTENAPTQGTSWAQKQGALNTAAKFRQDPSSVSMTDARGALSTANNFRQRHGDQVQAAVSAAAAKKPPPPPPPKKKFLTTGEASEAAEPPPVPLGSKPR